MTRRELLALIGARLCLCWLQRPRPTLPPRLSRWPSAPSYDGDLTATLATMFDQIGGLDRIVKGKTVTIKLNLTGSPGLRFKGRPLGVTHYTHPKVVGATAYLMGRAGRQTHPFRGERLGVERSAGRVHARFRLERALDRRRRARTSSSRTPTISARASATRASRCPADAYMYPAYDLNHAYEDTDVFVSMAKLKNHETCGVTLSLKNCFGDYAGFDLRRRFGPR